MYRHSVGPTLGNPCSPCQENTQQFEPLKGAPRGWNNDKGIWVGIHFRHFFFGRGRRGGGEGGGVLKASNKISLIFRVIQNRSLFLKFVLSGS